jgi:hypothetical protein
MNARLTWILLLFSLVAISMGLWLGEAAAGSATVSGTVVDAEGLIPGSSVRVRATANQTLSNSSGDFTLDGLTPNETIEVTAWADGYYVASLDIKPPASGVILVLRPYHTMDHSDYTWTSPLSGSSDKACGNCHPMIFPQWEANAHGQAVSNPRFFSLYNGTDISGSVQIGPGFLKDFPGTAGNCANCHAPGSALDGYLTTDMNSVRDNITAGIHCDYCHKVGGVYLDLVSGTVHPNTPGVRSQKLLRPPPGDNIFFGPYDDIPDPDTYLPLTTQSQFCAPCHQFSFWGTPIYESFNEWLAHLQVGAANTELLQNSVTMTTELHQDFNEIDLSVNITNAAVGHHVPTDHPGRHLILTVKAVDDQEHPLTQLSGPQVPAWGGDQAGEPGTAYAKLLRDIATGKYPVVSYWKQSNIVSDNRIAAGESANSSYTFATPEGGGTINVTVELRFRRLFQELLDDKDWQTPDVIMEQDHMTIEIDPWWNYYLPSMINH